MMEYRLLSWTTTNMMTYGVFYCQFYRYFLLMHCTTMIVRPVIENTVSSLKAAGVNPTGVHSRNSLWNGSQVTMIDFVDDEVS